MQKQVCFDVMELLGKEKISKAMNKTEEEIISSINSGQGFGRYIQLSQEEDVEQIQDISKTNKSNPDAEHTGYYNLD